VSESPGQLKKIAAIIPCYNEAAGIESVIAGFPYDMLEKNGLTVTVYVVDNNSSDNTAAIAEKAGAVILHEPKKGKGNAMRAGFQNIPDDVDYVVMLDGDDTYSSRELFRLVEPLMSDFCDVIVGSRLGGYIQPRAMNSRSRVGNWLFTNAVRMLYHANVSDVLTGYFAWKKSALDDLRPHITSTGFAIEMEMITKMAQLKQRIIAVPISYHPRTGQSNLRPFRDGFRILAMLLKNLMWRPHRRSIHAHLTVAQAHDGDTFTPQKIVFVSDSIYPYMKGGKEKRLHEITKRLATMGHEVHIYTMHWWDSSDGATRESGVYLHALCKRYEMYHGNRRTTKEGILFGLACFRLFRVSFDVIDVDHMPFFPVFSTWIVCTLRGRKLFATWHEALSHQEWIGYMGVTGIIASLVERLSIMLPYRITAASARTKELLATIHGRDQRVELVASGIDIDLIRTVPPALNACDVLYVGRLVKDKHIDTLINAVAIAAQSYPKIRCMIIGQGIERARLQRQIVASQLEPNITILDPLAEASDVYAHMKAAKVFCSPSTREGFGITTLESLGCGTPVITISSPGNVAQYLIQDGQNGSVVPLAPAALATAILHWIFIAQKPDIADQVADHDWHQLAKKQAEVYTL